MAGAFDTAGVKRPGESVDGDGCRRHGTGCSPATPAARVPHWTTPPIGATEDAGTGKYLLERIDLVNLVCVLGNSLNGAVPPEVYKDVLDYCVERRAFLIVDPPPDWTRNGLVSDPTHELPV